MKCLEYTYPLISHVPSCLSCRFGRDVYILSFLTHQPDLRLPSTVPLNFTKSINLALSERGINAIRNAGRPDLLERVLSDTIPARGRMIHGKSASGELYQHAQDYDIHGRVRYPLLIVFILSNVTADELCHKPRRA